MNGKKWIVGLSLLLLAFLATAQSDLCRKSTEGTNFWFGFMESRNYHSAHFVEITVTARETSNFQVFIGHNETPFNGTYTVQANNKERVLIPWQMVEATGSEEIQDRGIRLVSEKPVNVYALNWDANSADVAVIYPASSLGNEYFAICYEPHISENKDGTYVNGRNSEFLIVATEDATSVAIVPSKVTDKLVNAGDTIKIVLNKGEVYQVQSMNHDGLTGQGDLTGSYVLADKPVAFYSGSLGTTVPADPGVSAWDHLYEQIPPVPSWGRDYYAVPLKSREQDRYRIMAAQDGTVVHVDGQAPILLNRGEFSEMVLYHNQPSRIYAEKPILVVQYSQSKSIDNAYTGGNGDPFMIVLSSSSQSKNDVTFVAYDSPKIQRYYVNVITLTEETGNLRLDGNAFQSEFSPFPNSQYSWAQLDLNPGTYRMWNTNEDRGFLAYVYGFGGVESYGYGVGFNLDLVLDLGESIDFQGDTLLLCHGESRTLDAGPYFDSYAWNTGETSQQLTVTEGGMYAVTTKTIDGCELKDSIFIYVSHPQTNLGADLVEECYPFSMQLDGQDGFEDYLWQNEAGDFLSDTRLLEVSQTGEYRLTVTDQYGCTAGDTMNLVVFPVPELSLSGQALICGQLSTDVSVAITGAPEPVWNYEGSFRWSSNKPDLVSFSGENLTSATVHASEWGTYDIYYHLNTIDGCEQADTFQVRFHPIPTSTFTFDDDSKCEGYSKKLIYTGLATDSATLYWDLDGCRFVDTIDWRNYIVTVGAFLNKPPYINLVIDDNGCWSDTTIIPMGAKPNYTMDADKLRGCDSLTVHFSSTLIVPDNVDYVWTFDDGEVITSQNATKHFDAPGFYDVGLTITNPVTGCQSGFTLDSMIRVFPTPTASIVADPDFCYPDSARVFYEHSIDSSFCYWSFDGAHQLGEGNDSITVLLDQPQASVQLVVDEYGCFSEPDLVALKRKPHFDFSAGVLEECQPASLSFFAEQTDPALDYTWLTPFSSIETGLSINVAFPDSGHFDMGLIGRSMATGCADTLLKPAWVWIHPKPVAAFEVDYPIATIENANLNFSNQTQFADDYLWDFGDTETSFAQNPQHTYLELGKYTARLFAESKYGCKDTSEMEIQILPFNVYTPNAFRPDSDIPENRTFMPVGLGADRSRFNLKVYDRWGQIMFESNTPDNPWDGSTKKGDPAPMGNYVWIARFFDLQGYEHNQKGQILLIR